MEGEEQMKDAEVGISTLLLMVPASPDEPSSLFFSRSCSLILFDFQAVSVLSYQEVLLNYVFGICPSLYFSSSLFGNILFIYWIFNFEG